MGSGSIPVRGANPNYKHLILIIMSKKDSNKVQRVENVVSNEVAQVVIPVENEVKAEQAEQVEKPNTATDTKEAAMSAESLSLKDAKKLIIDEFNAEFVTPFKVLNFVNKNRTKPAYKVVFEKYLIQDENGKQRKLNLTDLLSHTTDGENGQPIDIFCRLSSVDKKEQAVSTFVDKDGKTLYFIPVPFSVNGFFASMQSLFSYRKKVSALKAWNENETERKEHEKKQRAKLQKKVDELKENEIYKGLTEAQIVLIAREITGVRIAL